MAHHSATKKAIKQTATKRERNIARVSAVRTAVKNVRLAVAEGNLENANTKLRTAQITLDKAVTKGVVKKETASRTISRLNASVKKLVA